MSDDVVFESEQGWTITEAESTFFLFCLDLGRLEKAESIRWWRRVPGTDVFLQRDKDARGFFCMIVARCPDCGQKIISPRLRTVEEVENLIDADMTAYHRCAAMERN